jgi:hypothetical protein
VPRFLLINRFTVAIFVAVAALALAMSVALSTFLSHTLSQWEGQHIAAVLRHHADAADIEELFTTPHDAAQQARWAERMPDLVASVSDVTQCRVLDRDGTIIWSEDPTIIGQSSDDPSLQSALRGAVVGAIKERTPTPHAQEYAKLLDVYVPIVAANGRVLGVLEVYKLPQRLLTSLQWGFVAIWAVSLAGAALIYLGVLPLVKQVYAPRRRLPRPSSEIVAEVQSRFGFLPPFFEPAIRAPEVFENLWQQTLSAYVENPLPALFKEKLFAYLSRYCALPYCIVCHSCALRPLGMTASDVLALLETPPPIEADAAIALAVLVDQRAPLSEWPESGSSLERALMNCAVHMFLRPDEATRSQDEARRLLGPERYARVIEFLAYVKTCFLWVETHPELSYEADQRAQQHLRAFLAEDARLAEFFRTYADRVKRERRERESGRD